MAIVKTEKLGPFMGINNRLPRHALVMRSDKSKSHYLADAIGVDLDVTGRLSTAHGSTKIVSLSSGRSLYAQGNTMLYAEGGELRRVSTLSPFAYSVIDTVGTGKLAYEAINGDIYYSDGVKLSCLESAGSVRPVGVPVPASFSAVAASGSLIAASYQLTITYFNGVEEGGAYPSISLDLATTGGFDLTLPTPPAGVTQIGVYLSGPNDYTPLLHSVIYPVAGLSLTSPASKRPCRTQIKGPMPAGELLTHTPTHFLVAAGAIVYYSEQYNFGLTLPESSYITLPADVSVMIACENGVYIVADKTYWLTGLGTPQIDLIPIAPYGAVKFSQTRHPTEKKVYWLSAKGLVVGDDQGQFANLQEKNLLLDLAGDGASLFIEGNNRVVSTNG